MIQLSNLIKRHTVLFFKDKGRFFTALITPVILIILYMTFLGSVYKDALSEIVITFNVSNKMIETFVNSYLFSSLLAVSCVTVSFCSNMIMVQDKAENKTKDFLISGVSKTTLALSYFISALIITMIINMSALLVCFLILLKSGWYMPFIDIIYCILDVFLLTLFGTSVSSVVNFFLTTQGQISAVGTVVSAGYGFLCGAYMPISKFSPAIRNVLRFLPGTYGTALIRTHLLDSVFIKLNKQIPGQVLTIIRSQFDTSFKFMHHTITIPIMYGVMIVTCIVFIGVYVLLNKLKK